VHPIERLRAVARARDVEQTLLATEAAAVLGSLAADPLGLLTACRRLIDRHPAAGALWWTCARLLDTGDAGGAAAEARAIAADLADDPARMDLGLELPEGAAVAVVPDAAGGSDLAADLAGLRPDLRVADAGEEPIDARGILVLEAGAAGPDRMLAPGGTQEAVAGARRAGAAVWALVAVGRRLPGPLFDAVATRARRVAAGRSPDLGVEVVGFDHVDRVVEPRRLPCPCPPELLRPPAGW
jgi:hypothetical protein